MPSISQQLAGLPGRVKATALRNLSDAVDLLVRETKDVLSVQGTPTQRSRPGEAPRRQTGLLQASIHGEINVSTLQGRVVAKANYASYLQKGTRRMARRPFFDIAFRQALPKITAIMKRR